MSAGQGERAPRVSDEELAHTARIVERDLARKVSDANAPYVLDLRDARAEIALLNARLATARRDALLEAAGIAEEAWRDGRPDAEFAEAIRVAADAVKKEQA